jgi:glucokinase
MPDTILAADIGGTRARFLQGTDVAHATALELSTHVHSDFTTLLDAALSKLGAAERSRTDAVLAVAGPVQRASATLTNLGWAIEADELRQRFGFRRVILINDLEAAARALADTVPATATVLRAGDADASQRSAVISVSTGLGVAYWAHRADGLQVDAAEAGHMGFAPSDGWEVEFMNALERQHAGRVSWERVLSGEGLALLDAHLRGAEVRTPAEITRQAGAGEAAAVAATWRYSRLLGTFAGDLVLGAPALGGIWLMGGVLRGLGFHLDRQQFLEGFDAKGRLSPRLADVPVRMTGDDRLGVQGAWALARSLSPV